MIIRNKIALFSIERFNNFNLKSQNTLFKLNNYYQNYWIIKVVFVNNFVVSCLISRLLPVLSEFLSEAPHECDLANFVI